MNKIVQPAPKISGTCHFAALQPLLSQGYTTEQVRSLLALSLLFMQKLTFTDTQIADSPHLYREFRNPSREILVPLVRDTLVAGEARLLLRDGTYEGANTKVFDVANLADVYSSWMKQSLPGAWVVPPASPDRKRYVDFWNELIPNKHIITYDYVAVKKDFQKSVRDALVAWPELKLKLSSEEYMELRSLVEQSWFSHSRIYDFFSKRRRDLSEITSRFGLLDEEAYAKQIDVGLSATDVPTVLGRDAEGDYAEALAHANVVMAKAFAGVEVADLSLLKLLSFDEIMRIREGAKSLQDLLILLRAKEDLTDSDLQELSMALSAYWRHISDSLIRLHPGAAMRKTKLGLLLGRQSLIPAEEISEGISVILSGILGLLTGGVDGQRGIIRRAVDIASLRFLLSTPRDELKRLQRVMGRNALIAAPGSQIRG